MDVLTELAQRTQLFNEYWIRYFPEGEPTILYDAARHLPCGGGKRLRPFLAMVACESVDGDPVTALPFGAALELTHNFTLVHDDIMDHSTLRRNVPTVHMTFGEPTAILAGDFLFAKSFEAVNDITCTPTVFQTIHRGLVQCVIDICEGQQMDMLFEKRNIVSEEEYIDMITKKTAVLFQFAAQGGGLVGGGTTKEVDALTQYGRFLGLSFQIWDDYLDVSSNEQTLGKDIGNDIRNGKKTLIAVHTLTNASSTQQHLLQQVFGNKNATNDDIKKIFSLFKNIGSVDYARNTAMKYNEMAKKALSNVKESQAKQILVDLADYAIQREK